ncbi:ParB/RepB/Spo0J family partition protein [bacterium]|nr:ParB/RepB/Spo0J family partition protein [bacterium]
MSKADNNRLGRGLDALIPTDIDEFAAASMPKELKLTTDDASQLPIDKIKPNPYQPRSQFTGDDLEDLANSIKTHGIVQPLVVVKADDGYQLIAGERRLRAAKQVGLKTVPAVVRSFSEQEQLEIALIENIQRADLRPLELASAYQKLADQFNLSLDQISKRVGKAISTVSNIIRLLNLSHEAKKALDGELISEGHARTLLSVEDPQKQAEMLKLIIKHNLNVRQAEELARNYKQSKDFQTKKVRQVDTYQTGLTSGLQKVLGTKVAIQKTAKGGKVVIEFYSEEELNRLYEQITGARADSLEE